MILAPNHRPLLNGNKKIMSTPHHIKKSFLLIICMVIAQLAFAEIPSQETYKSHRVKQGETVYSIAKKYGLSEEAIYQLNPDARQGISENAILIIPATMNDKVVTGFKTHKVRRKETLFSISQKYGITVDDVKKYNKHLYASRLKKGEKIQIPVFDKTTSSFSDTNTNPTVTTVENDTKTKIHIVLPKETFYGIARKYGISVNELKALNPDLGDSLPIGAQLNVPETEVTNSAIIEEDRFDFYEVQPKEGFYRLKLKLGLSEEEIVALNPYAKDGLKEGMILKIPKEVSEELLLNVDKVDLENAIVNRDTKKIALMLPFQLARVADSLEGQKENLKDNRALRIALDFYSGVLMATEFAKDKGISTNLSIFDTEASSQKVLSLLSTHDFSGMDAVIGPLLSRNVEQVANGLKGDGVPVFSPLSNRDIKLTANLFQTLPDEDLLQKGMIQYLKDHYQGKNMILISDRNSASKAAIMEAIPGIKTLQPREKGFLYVTDIQGKMDRLMENWVILESHDPVIISNVVGILNGLPDELKIRLFTTDKNENFEYEDISNMHLAHLQFTFPSISKSYNLDDPDAFLVSYKNKYGVYPNRFAARGFDLTYDILLRLASADDLYDAVGKDSETEYLENRFRYDKKMFSGYTNQAFYILKYNEELHFDVVK